MTTDFKLIVLGMIERMGRFQIFFMCISMVHHISVSINNLVTIFHIYQPPFHCRDNNSTNCNDPCPGGYVFEGNETTVVTEFQLVCSRKLLGPLLNSLYFTGVTIGAIVCGPLADIYGRKVVVISCLYLQGVLGISLYFTHTLTLVIVTRTVQGFFVQGLQGGSYTLMIEHCSPDIRTLAGALWEGVWPLGMFFISAGAYFIPDWHTLQVVLTIPSFITIFVIWMVPESLTWLITRNRLPEAYKLALKLARWNKDQICLDELKGLEPSNITVATVDDVKTSFSSMLKHPILRKHTFIMTSMWFSIALSYYAILYYLPTVGGNRQINFMVGAIFEMFACFIAYFVFRRWGRRIPMATYQYGLVGVCVAIAIFSHMFGPESDNPKTWSRIPITIFVQIGKAMAIASFYGMVIYASECFPTGCRGGAVGLCGFFARLGTILSPQVMVLGEYTFKSLSLIIVAATTTITATSTLFLPETLGIVLPNTIEDVEKLWG